MTLIDSEAEETYLSNESVEVDSIIGYYESEVFVEYEAEEFAGEVTRVLEIFIKTRVPNFSNLNMLDTASIRERAFNAFKTLSDGKKLQWGNAYAKASHELATTGENAFADARWVRSALSYINYTDPGIEMVGRYGPEAAQRIARAYAGILDIEMEEAQERIRLRMLSQISSMMRNGSATVDTLIYNAAARAVLWSLGMALVVIVAVAVIGFAIYQQGRKRALGSAQNRWLNLASEKLQPEAYRHTPIFKRKHPYPYFFPGSFLYYLGSPSQLILADPITEAMYFLLPEIPLIQNGTFPRYPSELVHLTDDMKKPQSLSAGLCIVAPILDDENPYVLMRDGSGKEHRLSWNNACKHAAGEYAFIFAFHAQTPSTARGDNHSVNIYGIDRVHRLFLAGISPSAGLGSFQPAGQSLCSMDTENVRFTFNPESRRSGRLLARTYPLRGVFADPLNNLQPGKAYSFPIRYKIQDNGKRDGYHGILEFDEGEAFHFEIFVDETGDEFAKNYVPVISAVDVDFLDKQVSVERGRVDDGRSYKIVSIFRVNRKLTLTEKRDRVVFSVDYRFVGTPLPIESAQYFIFTWRQNGAVAGLPLCNLFCFETRLELAAPLKLWHGCQIDNYPFDLQRGINPKIMYAWLIRYRVDNIPHDHPEFIFHFRVDRSHNSYGTPSIAFRSPWRFEVINSAIESFDTFYRKSVRVIFKGIAPLQTSYNAKLLQFEIVSSSRRSWTSTSPPRDPEVRQGARS